MSPAGVILGPDPWAGVAGFLMTALLRGAGEGGVPASEWVNILPFWRLLLVAEEPAILAQRHGHAIDASADVH